MLMNVISEKVLRNFWSIYPDAETPLLEWVKTFRSTDFSDFHHIRIVYPHADYKVPLTIFNIGGNKYRLLVDINYEGKRVLVRAILTHEEYDKINLNTPKVRENL